MSTKQRDLQPELNKLKEKYKYDKKKLAEMQMELFKKHGINPGSGCLTTLITFVFMIAIYNVVRTLSTNPDISVVNSHILIDSLKFLPDQIINTSFLYLNLSKPDPYIILTIIAVVLQFLATKMIMPYTEIADKAVQATQKNLMT